MESVELPLQFAEIWFSVGLLEEVKEAEFGTQKLCPAEIERVELGSLAALQYTRSEVRREDELADLFKRQRRDRPTEELEGDGDHGLL